MAQQNLALITGVSGFIAKHVALRFLAAGWAVRGTLRSLDRADEVRQALAPHLTAAALANLSFAKADLTSDDGWASAAAGVQVLVHMASPFPMAQPKDPSELITPAVQGLMGTSGRRGAHPACAAVRLCGGRAAGGCDVVHRGGV